MWLVLISVSIGIFDDILIPADAMQHPSRLYPFVMINRSHVKFSSTSGLKASREEVWLSGILSSWRFFWRRKDVDESAKVWLVNRRKTCNTKTKNNNQFLSKWEMKLLPWSCWRNLNKMPVLLILLVLVWISR